MPDTYQEPAKAKEEEPSEDEKSQVLHWLQRVKRAEEEPKRKAWVELLETLRGYVYGTKHDDKTGKLLTRTNLVFATIAAMVPRTYAKNPDISVSPTAACPRQRLPMIKKFSATAEAVLSHMFVKEAKLKTRAKANLRSAMTTSYGVLKMIYQKSLQGDPLVIRRIQDAQDNLARVEQLIKDMKEGEDPAKLATQRDELSAQLTGLRSGNEIKVFKGFVIDRVRSEDFLILDDSIAEFDEYVDAAALAHIVWMTCSDYEAKFGKKPAGATKYNKPFATQEGQQSAEQGIGDMFVCVVEIWDKSAQVIRTVAKGSNCWARDAYAPEKPSQRWYPFFLLGFNLVEGRWRPNSDVELLMGLQDEYNTTRTNFADVRKKAVPINVVRKGGNLTQEDIGAITKAKNGDTIAVEGNPSVPIEHDMAQLPGLKIDPAAYDVSLIRNDMDMVSGMSDASRANLIKPKTATEAEIMQQSLSSRVDERRDTNEDLITDMAQAALEIAMRDMSKEEVKRIAGEDAEWPEAPPTVDEIFAMVDVSVRAGSSGKPNADKEREQWTQLLPVVQKTMETVMQLRASGHYDMADSAIELLRETLRRFQDRLDVDSLIPPVERGGDGQPIAQAQAAQQLAEMQAKFQELQQALQECQQELQKAQAGEQSKIAAEQAKQQQAVAAEETKRAAAAADAARADEKAAAEERLRSQEIERKDALARDQMEADKEIAMERIRQEQATKIEVAAIAAGVKTPSEQKAIEESAATVAQEQADAQAQERAETAARFEQNHQAIMGIAEAMQNGMGDLVRHLAAEREVVIGADGMPIGTRIKQRVVQ